MITFGATTIGFADKHLLECENLLYVLGLAVIVEALIHGVPMGRDGIKEMPNKHCGAGTAHHRLLVSCGGKRLLSVSIINGIISEIVIALRMNRALEQLILLCRA